MPQLQSINHSGGDSNILEVGSDFVTYIETMLTDESLTTVHTSDTTQVFSPRSPRASNPTDYTRSHRILSKALDNGTTIYIELFNLLVDVERTPTSFWDTQFLCVSYGEVFSAGQITDRSPVVAMPIAWFAGGTTEATYTSLLSLSLYDYYGSLYRNTSAALFTQTRIYTVDLPDLVSIGFCTKERDRLNATDLKLNTQFFTAGGFSTAHPTLGDTYCNYNVHTEDTLATYNATLTTVFTGLSGYFKPEVAHTVIPQSDKVYYKGTGWETFTLTTRSDATYPVFYANADGTYPTQDVPTANTFGRAWANNTFIGRSVMSGFCTSGLNIVVSNQESDPTNFTDADGFIVQVSTPLGSALRYNAGAATDILEGFHGSIGYASTIFGTPTGSYPTLIGEATDV